MRQNSNLFQVIYLLQQILTLIRLETSINGCHKVNDHVNSAKQMCYVRGNNAEFMGICFLMIHILMATLA